MSEQMVDEQSRALMHDMGIDEAAVERRKAIVGLQPADISRIVSLAEVVRPRAADIVQTFFARLAAVDEARPLLADRVLAERARQLEIAHIEGLVSGDYGLGYVEERLELSRIYAKAGLETRIFLGAYHHMMRNMGAGIMQAFERKPMEGFESFMSLKKAAFFDISLTVDVLVYERERIIRQQQEAIRELSTPVLQIRGRLLLIPIIGVIDTHRARLITESLLKAIRDNRARVVVMDVTGVATIDSRVANHILQTVAAARLMGAFVVVTGISSDVAQSLVALGIELSKLNTIGDLQGGLEEAERLLGYRVVQVDGEAAPGLAGS